MKLFGGNGSGKDKSRYTSEHIPEDWPVEWFEQASSQTPQNRPPQEPPRRPVQRPLQEDYRRPPQQRPVQDARQRPVQRSPQEEFRQRPVQRQMPEERRPVRQSRNIEPDYDELEPARRTGRGEGPPPKKRRGRGVLKIFLMVLLSMAIICGGVFAYWKITTKAPVTNIFKPSEEDPSNVSPEDPVQKTPTYQEERYYTLLVVGDDQEGGNTDTIMLVRFDTVDMTANVVSIPRDTIVNLEWRNKKINTIFHNAEDGMEALKDEIEHISGIKPNNYIMVDTEVFVDVVDAMGGVDFNVPFDMDYDDWGPPGSDYYFGIHLKEGFQTLSGYDALGVFRWRKNTDGGGHQYANPDIDRISTQHDLLMAIAQKAMSIRNVATLVNIASSVLPKCETDLSIGNIQWYMEKFLSMSLENVHFYTLPGTSAIISAGIDNAYLFVNVDEWLEIVNEHFNPYDNEIEKDECSIVIWTKSPDLIGYFYYVDYKSLTTTDGTPVNDNFYIPPG